MDIVQIMATIQHRYPFLLIDRIVELEPGVRAVGLKNVTANEPFMPGHFPGNPMMPGMLIVEHAAQVSCALLLSSEALDGKLGLFTSINDVKFTGNVVPGDQLLTEVVTMHLAAAPAKCASPVASMARWWPRGSIRFYSSPTRQKHSRSLSSREDWESAVLCR